MQFTLAQLNFTIGAISENVAMMRAAASKALFELHSSMVVFSELGLCAYYPGDMLDEPAFIAACELGLEEVRKATLDTPGLYWVIGAPRRRTGPGKRLANSLFVVRDGEILLSYDKQLLPTYGIFDDRRHFEPGDDVAKVFSIGGVRVGVLVCEDGWNDDGKDYAVNPFKRLADASPDLILSINASPSNIRKREQRHEIFGKACAHHRLPLAYVNQVGGHDDLVYDGGSFWMGSDGKLIFEAKRFEEDLLTIRLEGNTAVDPTGEHPANPDPAGLPTSEFYRRQIVLGIRDYARRCGFRSAVLGLSGGIDSALTLALAIEAIGVENVVAITMPSRFSSTGSVTDSEAMCSALGVQLLTHPIERIVAAHEFEYEATNGRPPLGLTLENLQARVRGTILMEYSNDHGHLVLTTGNKSETSCGYATLYGDMSGGLAPISDLYKTEVFDLARHINHEAGREIIPAAIIDKPPSAELAPGQRDSDSLPDYPVLDDILRLLIDGADNLADDERAAAQRRVADPAVQALLPRIKQLIARSEYKRRQAAPGIRVRRRAFGRGRQFPIAAKHIFGA